jgi:hypothetical protein
MRRLRHAWQRWRYERYIRRNAPPHAPPPIEPSPAERAARVLAANEAWPAPGGLRALRRRLLGDPATESTDAVALRADADRIADAIRTSDRALPTPHPGLENLQHRSRRRTLTRSLDACQRVSRTLANTTRAQADLDAADYERNAAASELLNTPEPLPAPRFGAALTGTASVLVVLCAVMIPLESYLTYRQLLVLGMSNGTTRTISILIGLSLVVVAEVVGLLLHYLMTHPGEVRAQEREAAAGEPRAADGGPDGVGTGAQAVAAPPPFAPALRGLGAHYWFVVALTVVTVGTGVVTLDRLAAAREHNQQIVDARDQRQQAIEAQLAQSGYLNPSQSGDAGTGAQESADSSQVDLSWTFWLQTLALLAGVGIALRKRDADAYNERQRDRRQRVIRARRAERTLQRRTGRVARATGRHEAAMREIRAIHEQERELLQELFGRVRARAIDMAPALVPEFGDLERDIDDAIAPHLPALGQTTVDAVPVPQPPPPPRPFVFVPPERIDWDRVPVPVYPPASWFDGPRPAASGPSNGDTASPPRGPVATPAPPPTPTPPEAPAPPQPDEPVGPEVDTTAKSELEDVAPSAPDPLNELEIEIEARTAPTATAETDQHQTPGDPRFDRPVPPHGPEHLDNPYLNAIERVLRTTRDPA